MDSYCFCYRFTTTTAGFVMKGAKSKAEAKDTKLSVKKGAVKKSTKKDKDPNMPKRPPSALFVFMYEYILHILFLGGVQGTVQEKHPGNKSVAVVAKAGGSKWKSMTEADKAPYVAKADKRKTDYEKNMEAYNKKLAQGTNATEDDGPEVDEEDGSGEKITPELDGHLAFMTDEELCYSGNYGNPEAGYAANPYQACYGGNPMNPNLSSSYFKYWQIILACSCGIS
ncbi:hypothetical protein RHMOL_Rhmol01G0001700 [Rhododendron molle]|uniref:Uncharacterized protein n=1 Tax=Rhododendron molle TaxID=49168 RepID=A0ACC0PX16_RHOML|nr:hypothetical protein RHMOL_Rhmol01G0001700 [Rhododendron molle]